MKEIKFLSIIFVLSVCIRLDAQESSILLPDTIIGTRYSIDYSNSSMSSTINSIANAFDSDLNTFFASYVRSGGWVGLDLGEKHVITKVAFCSRAGNANRMQLGVFEGANTPDFIDAIPIFLITETPKDNIMTEFNINCSRGFRYVRYIGPNDAQCNIAEIEFHGYADEGDDSMLYQTTNLPDVIIHTLNAIDIVDPYKEVYRKGTISIISDDGETIFSEITEIRGRGNNSWTHPKKPYKLKLDKKANLLGLPAEAKEWTLINNYGDKTLMRNYLAFDISRRFEMEYTPAIKLVNVYLNGEYKGCYQLCDHMEVNENRVNVEKMDSTETQQPNISGGYMLEIDVNADKEISWFRSNTYIPVTIKYPDDDEINPSQKAYIHNWFNRLEAAILYDINYKNPETGYRKFLDTESFIRQFLIGEFIGNTDTYWSVYMYKRRNDDKFYFGPVWDCDLAFDNDHRTYPINSNPEWIYSSTGSYAYGVRHLVNRLFTDEGFFNEVKSIYAKYRDSGAIKEDVLMGVINNTAEQLEESQKLNFTRWKIMNSKVHENPVVHGSYKAEVDNVKKYVRERIVWMDKKLGYTPSYDPGTGNINSDSEGNLSEIVISSHNNFIHIEGITQPVKIEVYSIDGKSIFSKMQYENSIDIKLPKGFYIIKLSDTKGHGKSVKCVL